MRAPKAWLSIVDEWRRNQPDIPPRAEAIRRLVEQGLESAAPMIVAPGSPLPSPPLPDSATEFFLPEEMIPLVKAYLESRPHFESPDEAVGFLVQVGLDYAEMPENIVELDDAELRAIKRLAHGKEVSAMAREMLDYARRAYAARDADGDTL